MLKKPEMTPVFPSSPRMTTTDTMQLAKYYKNYCEIPAVDVCDNGQEILKNRICDGVPDCDDFSDESGCGDYNCPSVIQFSSSIKFKDRDDKERD